MAESTEDLQTELAALRLRRAKIAGIDSTAFADQSTRFDHESLDSRIATIERQLATRNSGTSTRYAATSKGC